AGGSGEVCDGTMDANIHLIQRLLHPLDTASALADKVAALALKRTKSTDMISRTKGPAQQGATVQKLQPLAVSHVRLAARHVLQRGCVDQDDFEPSCFEHLIQRNPVHVGALHRDRLDTLLQQPRSQILQFWRGCTIDPYFALSIGI